MADFWGTGSTPDVPPANSFWRDEPRTTAPPPPRAPQPPPMLAAWTPATASAPQQRYLRAAGWTPAPTWKNTQQQYRPRTQPLDDRFDAGTVREIEPYAFALTPWQMEESEKSFGYEAADTPRELLGPSVQTAQMTPEAMAGLNDKQRQALQFNEMLISATEADRALDQPEGGDTAYQSRAEEMFGTQGTSEIYAPNTLNLLEQMGMGRLRGQDLDEYLSLDRAFDIEEIGALQTWDATPEIAPYSSMGESTSPRVQQALDRRQVDLAGQLVETALASDALGWDEQSRVSSYLGLPGPAVEDIPFGYLPADTQRTGATEQETANLMAQEGFYQGWFEHFSDPTMETLDDFWLEALGTYAFTEEDLDEFFTYIYNRSFDLDRAPVEGLRSGAEMRQWLGMGG